MRRVMIKKLLEIFRRRRYVKKVQRDITESDLKKELDEVEKNATNKYKEYKRRNMEIQILREVLEESDKLYSESEINSLFNSIMVETQKL
ncbi:hypothetical protein [Aquimarina algiphila]|uniref:hypothetical protein n=1 Tax=Aquimarina algiphila TaxID=2047982 RepID=UPI00232CD0BD|nr:hypothetical protein [Aquimarina algiphila]